MKNSLLRLDKAIRAFAIFIPALSWPYFPHSVFVQFRKCNPPYAINFGRYRFVPSGSMLNENKKNCQVPSQPVYSIN